MQTIFQISLQLLKKRFGIHPDLLKLGLVSFLTDLGSEMIFSIFAVFFHGCGSTHLTAGYNQRICRPVWLILEFI